MTTTTNVQQVKLNIMTQSQYNSATKNATELYIVTDAQINYNDLSNKPTIPTKTSDLTNDSGYITVIPTATTSSLGVVQPDGTTITINNGVISSSGGGGLPSQTGNAGKVLTTDGTDASWGSTANVYPVIETYINGTSWYRIYAPDNTGYRWCEMGDLYYKGSTLAATDNQIAFLKTFKDVDYLFTPTLMHSDANLTPYSCYEKYTSRTTSSTIIRIGSAVFGYEWRACGYIANEES